MVDSRPLNEVAAGFGIIAEGGEEFINVAYGKNANDAFNNARKSADDEYGHREGYSGEINSVHSFSMGGSKMDIAKARKIADKRLDDMQKRDCECIPVTKAFKHTFDVKFIWHPGDGGIFEIADLIKEIERFRWIPHYGMQPNKKKYSGKIQKYLDNAFEQGASYGGYMDATKDVNVGTKFTLKKSNMKHERNNGQRAGYTVKFTLTYIGKTEAFLFYGVAPS